MLVTQSCPTLCWPQGLEPTRLLLPWDSPVKNTRVGSHSLFQGIFLTLGLNFGLLHGRQILYHLSHQGSSVSQNVTTLGDSIFPEEIKLKWGFWGGVGGANLIQYDWCSYSESRSVVSDSLWPHGLSSPWNSPGKNVGVRSHSLFQGIFLTLGSNPGLLHCKPGSPAWAGRFFTIWATRENHIVITSRI